METQRVPHMTDEAFRAAAHEVVDWIIDYHARGVRGAPVMARVRPGEVASGLAAHAPEKGEPFAAVMADFQRVVMPGVTHWQAPGFHAFFPSAYSHPSLLGDMLCGALGAVGFIWQGCPAMTEVETRVMDWLGEMIGLPGAFLDEASGHVGGGVIQGTASEAVLVAMLAARARVKSSGKSGALTAYCSTQAHSSVVKAAMVSGVGRENVRLIGTDERLAMRVDLLEEAMAKDAREGRTPFFVCATVGTTSTTAVDPVRAAGVACAGHAAWLHVDAAYAGAAMVCPEFRWMNDGVELADSYNFNPHKWLLTGFDCSALWVRDRRPLIEAMSITPEYLRNSASDGGGVIDYRDWQVPLGRRFRALKLWFVIRHYGAEGLRAFIREEVGLAEWFEALVREDSRRVFEVVFPRTLGLVCLRLREGDDAAHRRVVERVNAGGFAYLTPSVVPLKGRPEGGVIIRVSIGNAGTTREHLEGLLDRLCEAAGSSGGSKSGAGGCRVR